MIRRERRKNRILWDQIEICPAVQLKFGIKRKILSLAQQNLARRGLIHYANDKVDLKGRWDNSPRFGSRLALKLTNRSSSSIRIARLVFPTENGLDDFIKGFNAGSISFLRNGYQSWSTARSYKLKDKPLRPWLSLVSLASSNMANLPSNTAGILSSEMYSIITDLKSKESFLVGQGPPFNHFFYIRLNLYPRLGKTSHFELVFDFGRKLMAPGETIDLDAIIMAKGELAALQDNYFSLIRKKMRIRIPAKSHTGWCTWYYYFNRINPQLILDNLREAQQRKLPLDYFQIDDGYQKMVGDWLDLAPMFEGRMEYLADSIKEAGYRPGIWVAPFVADKKSDLARNHPEYLLRNEFGQPIVAGYNIFWPGHWYYGLDITNPRFEEYIRRVIRTLVREWGFAYLKCDFLFGGCLRGGTHNDLTLSRAEVLKRGMAIIRQEAGRKTVIVGCGMPLSTGIGTIDAMRVGPDTGPYWKKLSGALLNTGAMVGARNSIRNVLVRSAMHRQLWLNDPDCLMMRTKKTHLKATERFTQINAIILSGGLLLYSDDLSSLPDTAYSEMETITALSRECAGGTAIAIDLMEREMPELYYNSAGYLGVFNFLDRKVSKRVDLTALPGKPIARLVDVWTGEQLSDRNGPVVSLGRMPPHSSRLFKLTVAS